MIEAVRERSASEGVGERPRNREQELGSRSRDELESAGQTVGRARLLQDEDRLHARVTHSNPPLIHTPFGTTLCDLYMYVY